MTTLRVTNRQPQPVVVTQQVPVVMQQPQYVQAPVMTQTSVAIPVAVATQAYPTPAYGATATPIAEATLVSN